MPDSYITKQLIAGNKHIFEDLFSKYYGDLLLYASAIVGNHEIAKDLVQDVFLKVWEKRKQIAIKTSMKSYLLKTMKNACLDYIKHKSVIDKYTDLTKIEIQKKEADLLFTYLRNSNPEINEDRINKILTEIEKLPAQCQTIFKLSRFDGMKNKEIATKLNISTKTVDNQIYRALNILRKKLNSSAAMHIFFNLL